MSESTLTPLSHDRLNHFKQALAQSHGETRGLSPDIARQFTLCATKNLRVCPRDRSLCSGGSHDQISGDELDDSCISFKSGRTTHCLNESTLSNWWRSAKLTKHPFEAGNFEGPGCSRRDATASIEMYEHALPSPSEETDEESEERWNGPQRLNSPASRSSDSSRSHGRSRTPRRLHRSPESYTEYDPSLPMAERERRLERNLAVFMRGHYRSRTPQRSRSYDDGISSQDSDSSYSHGRRPQRSRRHDDSSSSDDSDSSAGSSQVSLTTNLRRRRESMERRRRESMERQQ